MTRQTKTAMALQSKQTRLVADSKEDRMAVDSKEPRIVPSSKEAGALTPAESPQSAESTSGCNSWILQVLLSIESTRVLEIR